MQISHSRRILDVSFPRAGLFPPSTLSLGRFFIWASSSICRLLRLFPQYCAQMLNIARHDSQCHVALKTVHAMIGAFIQAMHAQRIDRRFDRNGLSAPRMHLT